MTGSASGELIAVTPANLMIGSVVADNGLAKELTKAGRAVLTVTSSNTYIGATIIGAGIYANIPEPLHVVTASKEIGWPPPWVKKGCTRS